MVLAVLCNGGMPLRCAEGLGNGTCSKQLIIISALMAVESVAEDFSLIWNWLPDVIKCAR